MAADGGGVVVTRTAEVLATLATAVRVWPVVTIVPASESCAGIQAFHTAQPLLLPAR